MHTRIEKTNYYLDIAEVVAARCTCLRRHYGAVIVNTGISRVVIRDDRAHWREIAVSDWVENDDSMTDALGY